ncbi:MAG: indole-3-glycerol phosphate synthase TrpC [Verrucomicrobiota bacterium]
MAKTTFENKLLEICASKRPHIEQLRPHAEELRKQALLRDDFRPFRFALQHGSPTGMGLIAEVKKASPSAGVIAPDFDPLVQAREYARGGAQALSVLTDEAYFQGHLAYLRQIRDQVELPLLRKDFILDELQVYESVLGGADAVLLIVAAFTEEWGGDDRLQRLYETARACQLDVLVEVHDLTEMDRALDLGADIIGINNRNLRSFEVTLDTTAALAEEIPNDALAVSESGIKTAADVQFCREHGVNAILVGETLMRANHVPDKIRELIGVPDDGLELG